MQASGSSQVEKSVHRPRGEGTGGKHSAALVSIGRDLVEALGLGGVGWGQEVWGWPFQSHVLVPHQ